MFVVSPHLDDAVLGIGQEMSWNPGGVCVTVFAGRPSTYGLLSERPHDDRCGFEQDDDVVAVRRAEDVAALNSMGWEAVHLEWLDAGYLWPAPVDPNREECIVADLDRAWREAGKPGEVWTVAGISHPDHLSARDAVVAFGVLRRVEVRVWDEPGYRSFYPPPKLPTRERAREWVAMGDRVVAKLALVCHYRSQLNGLTALAMRDALTEETWATWED